MSKFYVVWIILAAFLTATLIHSFHGRKNTINSLTYYPNDPAIYFLQKQTSLSMEPVDSSTNYKIEWTTSSRTNLPVYLRQDVSLLFQNGRLIQVSNKWKKDAFSLEHHQTLLFQGISHLEALSVHYAESHPTPDQILSKETMSYDHLYVLANGYDKKEAFRVPIGKDQTDFQDQIKRSIQQEQHYILEKAAEKFNITVNNYDVFPLTQLEIYQQNNLPRLQTKTSQRVISQLWEGLYRNYVLGIPINGTKKESPIGSSVPLILYPKQGDQLLVIIRTKDGHLVQLKQKMND